jgi:SAM-dependent methyltransferase
VVVSVSQENGGSGACAGEHGSRGARTTEQARAVLWHDLECGSYAADLPLWRELASLAGTGAAGRPLLDVGAGTGRVALDLAGRGHRVTALDLDAEFLDALRERAAKTPVETVCADARTFELSRRDYAVCVAPMQTVQLLGGVAGRLAFLRRARAHLRPGGVLACAIVTEIEPFDCAAGDVGPSPEVVGVDGTDYVSRAVCVRVGRRSVRIERERSVLPAARAASSARGAASAQGASSARTRRERDVVVERDVVELDRLSATQLRHEGHEAGLVAAGARSIPATDEHVGGEVVLLRA